MTPQSLIALAAMLLELRNWLELNDPGSLDEIVVEECVNICVRTRRKLMTDGAR